MRQKWYIFPAVLSVVILLGIYQWYSSFISRNIYEESIVHLQEIYTQVDRTFAALVVKNWRLLDCWASYMDHLYISDTEDDVISLIDREKEQWGFTEFYFLDEEGRYQTLDGKRGSIYLGSELSDLTQQKKEIATDGVLSDGKEQTVFAIPTRTHSIKGFTYSAMAVSYSSEDMVRVINVEAFSGKSDCYVVSSNGDVLFSTKFSKEQPENLLTYLKKNGQMTEQEYAQIQADLENGTKGNLEYQSNSGTKYIVYMPVRFKDWMLAGMVSKNVIGKRLNNVQILTTSVLAFIFIIIFITGFWLLIRRNKIKLDEKSNDIKYREELFGILANLAEDIFVMFSKNGYKVEYISPNFEEITGIPVTEIKSDIRNLDKLYTHSTQEIPLNSRNALEKIPLNGCWQDEIELSHYKTGESHWYCEMIYRVSVSDSEKFILVLSDRTAEKRQNQALKQALAIAESANNAKSSFLFNMSHDIRTPMNAIVGYALLLDKDADKKEKIKDYAHKITASSKHLLGLINDILDMSKIESGKTKLNFEEFNCSEILEDICAVIRPQAKAKNQDFSIKLLSMKDETLIGDKVRISQVLINLLSNAVKYTPENGKIEFVIENLSQTSQRFARMSFIIRDNGIGMSKEFLGTIYDPFARERNSTISKIQGTGLGLAITKNLLDLMGGTISVKSSPGKGSEFTVNMSLQIPKHEEDRNFWKEYKLRRLLVVDADEDICKGIYGSMNGTGVEVSYAITKETAIELAETAQQDGKEFDIILIDETFGSETAAHLSACSGQDTILITTIDNYDNLAGTSKATGKDALLAKPFFISGLEQVIRKIKGESSEETESKDDDNPSSLLGLHILVAEDNEINSEILMELLKMEGASCEVSENGKAVLEQFKNSEPGKYDLILMDVQMPVMDGYQATKAIRSCGHPDAETIPIAAMTANAFTEDIDNAFASGMNAHISKPIDMNVLRNTVMKLLKENHA